MAVLAANRPVPNVLQGYASGVGYIIDAPVGAGEEIYQGSFVSLADDKYAEPLTKPNPLYGVSLDRVSGGAANGTKTCRVLVEGVIQHTLASVAQADIGKAVCATDDATLHLTNAGANTVVGILINVPVTGTAIVKLNKPRTELVDFVVTNFTSALTFNCAAGTDAHAIDGVGTVIKELLAQGVLSGTVA